MKQFSRLAFFALLVFVFGIAPAMSQDLPGAPANIQTIPAGSLVIPMDNTNQAVVAPFNLKAYGLVDRLLQNGVPVMWAIKAGKAKDAVDFTASARRVYPSAVASASVNFSGGPFIVHRDFKDLAGTIVSAFGNSVAVYELTADASVDIRYVDTFKPSISVGNGDANQAIHTSVFNFALIPEYVVETPTALGATACRTLTTHPHTTDTTGIANVKAFVQSGGNLLAECAALATFENNAAGRFQTTNGITNLSGITTPFAYQNADMAYNQYVGAVQPDLGGLPPDYQLNGGAFANSAHILVHNTGANLNTYAASASKLFAGRGGMAFYLGGHDFRVGTTIGYINGQRMILNTVFVPPTRPSTCNLDFPGTTGYKSVKVTNDATGDGFPTEGDTLTWTITYPNIGSAPITNFQIAEILPAGVTLVGSPTVTLSGTGTTATVNPSYLGTAGAPNLFNAGAVLGAGGKIVVDIQTTINAGFVGTLSNQTTASGTGLPGAGVKSDNIDNSTTGLLGATSVPASSATQVQDSAVVSPTTLQVFAPLAVKLQSASAIQHGNRVKIQWESGYESDNLGYNVYRQGENGLNLVTPAPIAGSALSIAKSRRHNSGFAYSAIDENPGASGSYWLEDLDMDGTRTLHGPIIPISGKFESMEKSFSIEELNNSGPIQPVNTEHPEIEANVVSSGRIKTSSLRADDPSPRFSESKQSYIVANSFAKLSIKHDAWYRVARTELESVGLPANFDMRNLRVFAEGIEQPITIRENGDVMFFGRGLDTRENHSRVYWLMADSHRGLRSTQRNVEVAKPNTDFFMNVVEKKDRRVYASGILNGDAENFFSGIVTSNGFSQELLLKSLAANQGTAKLRVSLYGLSEVNHLVQVSVNGNAVQSVNFFGLQPKIVEVPIETSLLREGSNIVSLRSLGAGFDISVVATTSISYPRKFVADSGQLTFGLRKGEAVAVDGFGSSEVSLFDVTNPNAVNEMLVAAEKSENGFSISISPEFSDRILVAFDESATLRNPESIVRTTQFESQPNADLLIIAKSQFIDAVAPLVQLRREQGLRVSVVNAQEIFDTYGFGLENAQAIKNFLTSTRSWSRQPRYVLLVGDSTYDPRNYLGRSMPTMLPAKLLDTQALETASDDWFVDFNGDEIPEIAIGRLPVRTPEELNLVVTKIVNNERSARRTDRKALVVSDEGFNEVANEFRNSMESFGSVSVLQRGTNDAETRQDLLTSLNSGEDIVNFVGHGSVSMLMSGAIFNNSTALQLSNQNRLSLFVMQSCLNGFAHDANQESIAEALLKAPNGGAYAVVASSGVNYPQGQIDLAFTFYSALSDSPGKRIGDALLTAKRSNVHRDVLRTTQLFGDPSSFRR